MSARCTLLALQPLLSQDLRAIGNVSLSELASGARPGSPREKSFEGGISRTGADIECLYLGKRAPGFLADAGEEGTGEHAGYSRPEHLTMYRSALLPAQPRAAAKKERARVAIRLQKSTERS